MKSTNWPQALKPLIEKYKGKKHPLDYNNTYQLLVMVVLSARDSDRHINSLAPALFKDFPNMEALASTNKEALMKHIAKVSGSSNKADWLLKIAQAVKQDKNIPRTMEGLTALPGIGRKSANVIMREAGMPAEGIMVDLHVVRVAPRLGIAKGTDPKKLEEQMMAVLPKEMWGETGMAMSHLGREVCRPSNPKHAECVMNKVCEYCLSMGGAAMASGASAIGTSKKAPGKVSAKAPVKKAAAKKVAVKKPAKKSVAVPAKKRAAEKAPAKKTVSKKSSIPAKKKMIAKAAKKDSVKRIARKK